MDSPLGSVDSPGVHQLDATHVECRVFTYKEGALSAMAHDLELRVERCEFAVSEEPPSIAARFDPRSLKVVTALEEGVPRAGLSASDRRQIEENTARDVLEVTRYPEISFRSRSIERAGEGFSIRGELTLHGRTRPLAFTSRPDGPRQTAEIRLHQPDFGIKPFSALLGAMRIRPEVLVRITVAWPNPPTP